MEIRSGDPLDTMIGGLDTIEIAAPVPYVSATFLSIVTRERWTAVRRAGHWPCLL